MAVVFHWRIQQDLREALRYYDSRGGVRLGDSFFMEAERVVRLIEADPLRFHRLTETLRRANLEGFPYHFLYEEHSAGVRVLVLRHHKRHPDFGLKRT